MKSYHSVVWVEEVPINTRSGQPFVMAVSGLGFNRRLINDQINTVQRTYIAQTRRFSGQSEETINGCTNRVFTTAVIISDLAKLAKVLCDNDNRRNPLGIGVSEAECFHEIVKDEATVMQMGCDMLKTFAVELIAVTRCNTTIGGALEEATRKDEVERLKSELKSTEVVKQLAVNEAVAVVEKQCDALKNNLERVVLEGQLEEKSLKDRYETQLRDRDDAIERLKDIKEKLLTKMVGETLEQHCEIEFNRLRATLFPRAYFEKDSGVRGGSKGDYIFRDSDESGTEFISIMFEMKNESDMTATKKKNEDFLRKLDKDRNEKSCEYAVLVSLLEPDSELYNAGIVDVSHRFSKMYIFRPRFFIQIINLLRNAAQGTLPYKTELARVREQNIDIINFESELDEIRVALQETAT